MSPRRFSLIPWSDKMRRVPTADDQWPEWMAPDDVVRGVKAHYLEAIGWLHDSAVRSWSYQWEVAARFLSGDRLKQHRDLLLELRAQGEPQVIGILRAGHIVDVRHFSWDGERCLVIDRQTQRRMATYHPATRERVHTQDLGSGIAVCAMVYHLEDRRWKIDAFIQDLPSGWSQRHMAIRIQEYPTLPNARWRDA